MYKTGSSGSLVEFVKKVKVEADHNYVKNKKVNRWEVTLKAKEVLDEGT